MDPEQPLGPPSILNSTQGVWFETIRPRFTMAVFSTFGLLGLALAAAGIYSLLSFHVTLRTHELGVRMALGAPRRQVLSLVILVGARLVLAGLVIGTAASLGLMRFLRSELFRVQPLDPLTYATAIPLLGLVALLACYLPARRAAAVDPMVALRLE
jgi:putative ABC transport system permease protein